MQRGASRGHALPLVVFLGIGSTNPGTVSPSSSPSNPLIPFYFLAQTHLVSFLPSSLCLSLFFAPFPAPHASSPLIAGFKAPLHPLQGPAATWGFLPLSWLLFFHYFFLKFPHVFVLTSQVKYSVISVIIHLDLFARYLPFVLRQDINSNYSAL